MTDPAIRTRAGVQPAAAPVLTAPGLEVRRLVLPPDGRAPLPAEGRERLAVPVNGRLRAGARLIAPLSPVALGTGDAVVENAGGTPLLAYILLPAAGTDLFAIGGRVRGTHRPLSDLDLLAIGRGAVAREANLGRVSVTLAPRARFLGQARAGAPFVASVLAAHRRLAGDGGAMAAARRQFGRDPAPPDAAHLADLARFCLGAPAVAAFRALALARARWTLRTFLWVTGTDPFGPRDALPQGARAVLTELENALAGVPGALPLLRRAAEALVAPAARLAPDAGLDAARAHFAATGNLLGLEVVAAIADHRARLEAAARTSQKAA